ncbi:MAG: efflux RND transporter periplasmic adaptor subunit [Candidatus Firestonebacteria bacterium]
MKKTLIILGISLIIIAAGVYFFGKYLIPASINTAAAGIEYKFKTVKLGDVTDKISEVGKLEPVSLVKVKSNVTGTVKKIFVEEGVYVKEGQKIALIKPGREAEQYQESEVLAPISGLVLEQTVEEGDMVTSGLSELSGGTAIISIANLDKMIVKIDINEVDIGLVKAGLPAEVKIEAFEKNKYIGKVLKISPQAKPSTDGRINVFKTEIEMVTKAPELHTGMKAVVEIVLREKKAVIIAPIECVFEEDGEQCAYLLKDNVWERRKVEVGLYDDNNIEITEGLAENEKISTTRPENFEKLFKENQEQKGGANIRQRMPRGAPGGAIR